MIGVYDSGFGGLTVLRALRRALPCADFHYFGDSGRAPYGQREADDILDYAEAASEFLFEAGCKVVVVACNTVSCVALRHLQQRYNRADRRILGVTIPAAELVASLPISTVLVLATTRTVASGTYLTEIAKLRPDLQVSQRAAPLLAPMVEEGWEDSGIADEACRRYLAGCDAEALLLGCTHYPLLRTALARVYPGKIVDPSEFVGARLAEWFTRHSEFEQGSGGKLVVSSTGEPERFAALGARFLGSAVGEVQAVHAVQGKLVPGRRPERRGQVVR